MQCAACHDAGRCAPAWCPSSQLPCRLAPGRRESAPRVCLAPDGYLGDATPPRHHAAPGGGATPHRKARVSHGSATHGQWAMASGRMHRLGAPDPLARAHSRPTASRPPPAAMCTAPCRWAERGPTRDERAPTAGGPSRWQRGRAQVQPGCASYRRWEAGRRHRTACVPVEARRPPSQRLAHQDPLAHRHQTCGAQTQVLHWPAMAAACACPARLRTPCQRMAAQRPACFTAAARLVLLASPCWRVVEPVQCRAPVRCLSRTVAGLRTP